MFMLARSCGVHLSNHSFVGWCYRRTLQPRVEDLRTHLLDVDADTGPAADRSGKCPALRRQFDAFLPGVDMGSTSRSGSLVVDSTPSRGMSISYEANQLRRRFSSSTSDTHAHRAVN